MTLLPVKILVDNESPVSSWISHFPPLLSGICWACKCGYFSLSCLLVAYSTIEKSSYLNCFKLDLLSISGVSANAVDYLCCVLSISFSGSELSVYCPSPSVVQSFVSSHLSGISISILSAFVVVQFFIEPVQDSPHFKSFYLKWNQWNDSHWKNCTHNHLLFVMRHRSSVSCPQGCSHNGCLYIESSLIFYNPSPCTSSHI